MRKLVGYTFNHLNFGCSDDDCIVVETGVDTADDNFVVLAVYKQTKKELLPLMLGQVFESDDLSIVCARCGAMAESFKDTPPIIKIGA